METLLFVVSLAIFVFFVLYSISTFALIVASLVETSMAKIERGQLFTPPARLRRPGITLIGPAYNMETVIVACAHSLLESDYEPLEVIIVDDGSRDGGVHQKFTLWTAPVPGSV